MKNEDEPVSADENIVRLIWREFLRPGEMVPILPVAFKPRANEMEGVSVFRLACLNKPMDALTAMLPEKRGGYAIAVFPVSELYALGLSVMPAKIDSVPGHARIPELNFAAVSADTSAWKVIQLALAQIAARNLILPGDSQS